jgi:hypothetical protein
MDNECNIGFYKKIKPIIREYFVGDCFTGYKWVDWEKTFNDYFILKLNQEEDYDGLAIKLAWIKENIKGDFNFFNNEIFCVELPTDVIFLKMKYSISFYYDYGRNKEYAGKKL